jgi:phosphomannomutase
LAGLYLLDYLTGTGKTPSQLLANLFKKVGPHYYDRLDIHTTEASKQKMLAGMTAAEVENIGGQKVVRLDTRDGFRYKLENGAWLLVRFSGTEPLVRIYAECASPREVQKLIQYGQEMVGV